MSLRRWLLLAAASALALALAWRAWPQEGPVRGAAMSAQVRPDSPASARRAPPLGRPRAQPAAPVSGAVRTGIAACDHFVERTMTCAQLPDDAKIAVAEASKAWAQVSASGDRNALEASCRATTSVQRDALAAMGC